MKAFAATFFFAFVGAQLSTTVQAQAACAADSAIAAKALIQRYVDMKNTSDFARLGEIYDAAYIENSGRNPSGLAAVEANWRGQKQLLPDLKVRLDDLIISGDKIVGRFTYQGTHTVPVFGIAPTGRPLSFGTIDIWKVRDCKLAEHWDQVDFAGLQRQLTAKQ